VNEESGHEAGRSTAITNLFISQQLNNELDQV
jgi:hypothetical protein